MKSHDKKISISKENMEALKAAQLKAIAKKHKIEEYYKMNKANLIESLQDITISPEDIPEIKQDALKKRTLGCLLSKLKF